VGLAGESKINGLSILLGIVASLAGYVVWKQKDTLIQKTRRIFSLSAVVSIVTVIVFLGSYPFLWPNPLGRTDQILTDRLDEMRTQSISHAPDAITTLNQRLTVIPTRIFQDYATLHFEGAWILNIILASLGVGLTLLKIRDWLKGSGDGVAAMVLLAVGVTAAFPTFFTLLDWDRYYLFPVFFSTAFIAIASGWLGDRAFRWAKTGFRNKTPTSANEGGRQ
jgi:hypothetical protein